MEGGLKTEILFLRIKLSDHQLNMGHYIFQMFYINLVVTPIIDTQKNSQA